MFKTLSDDIQAVFERDPAARSKCTSCNQCVAEFARPGGVRCVLNPENDPALNLRAAG